MFLKKYITTKENECTTIYVCVCVCVWVHACLHASVGTYEYMLHHAIHKTDNTSVYDLGLHVLIRTMSEPQVEILC